MPNNGPVELTVQDELAIPMPYRSVFQAFSLPVVSVQAN